MSKKIGFSVYVSTFEQQKPMLETLKGQGYPIFTSLHISEEVDDQYVKKVEDMCSWLHAHGFQLLADVSPYTLQHFQVSSLSELVDHLHIQNLRLDFGFDAQSLAVDLPDTAFTYNASTLLREMKIQEGIHYMHNFYPRPETGLDAAFFEALNEKIRADKGQVLAFISGDQTLRGPIYEGLPTLESHRNLAPYAQFVEMDRRFQVDTIFVGDVLLSKKEWLWIEAYLEENVIQLPVDLPAEYEELYEKDWTVRIDSPSGFMRLQESREYAQSGPRIKAKQTKDRPRGTITMDNEGYKRYSGEIQIMKKFYPADKRVNVIGQIDPKYHVLMDNIQNGETFRFVKN